MESDRSLNLLTSLIVLLLFFSLEVNLAKFVQLMTSLNHSQYVPTNSLESYILWMLCLAYLAKTPHVPVPSVLST